MSIASHVDDERFTAFDEAFEQGVICVGEFHFLRAVALDTGMGQDGQEMFVLKFALARARMNGAPDQVHPAIRGNVGRDALEGGIAALPYALADEPLLHAIWRYVDMLEGFESHKAVIEVCQQAAEIEGIELGPVPSYAESREAGLPWPHHVHRHGLAV